MHNCKTVMEPEVLQHIFETQVTCIYGQGKLQWTRVAAISPLTGQLEENLTLTLTLTLTLSLTPDRPARGEAGAVVQDRLLAPRGART